MLYALNGDLQWIKDYLKPHNFPFRFDHIMGNGFYRTFMTQEEYGTMKKEAKN